MIEQPASLGQDADFLATEAHGCLGVQDEPGLGGHPTILDDCRLPAHEAIAVAVRACLFGRQSSGSPFLKRKGETD